MGLYRVMQSGNGTNNTLPLQGWTSQPTHRGSMDIIWTCVITISLCSWSVLCLNLPALEDSAWRKLRRKFYLAALGVAGPEFVLGLALGQWSSARRSVEQFHRAGYRGWSMSHAFFADMGGFHLQAADWTAFPLNAEQVYYLVANKYIQHPEVAISEQIIAEKNKKEWFARVIVVIQIVWFVLNCIGRVAQHLALTTLELTTLGFILCTIGTSFFWAHKPSDACLPIVLKTEIAIAELLVAAGDCASEPYQDTPLDFVSRKEWSWSLYWSHWINILRRLHLVFRPKHRPVKRIANDNFPQCPPWILFVFFLFSTAYAALNLWGWNFTFPSSVELLLWRLSTCITLGTIILAWIVDQYVFGVHPIVKPYLLKMLEHIGIGEGTFLPLQIVNLPVWKALLGRLDRIRNNSSRRDPALSVPLKAIIPFNVFAIVYCFARAYVLVEDFVNLRALPPSAYQTVQWSECIPHFW